MEWSQSLRAYPLVIKMRRLLIIIIIILAFDIFITTAYFWYNQKKLTENNQAQENVLEKIEDAKNNALSEIIETNNQGDSLIVNKSSYQIIYHKNLDQFMISILKSPFEDIRQIAEQEFLQITQADVATVCKLDAVVTTPYFANPDLAGKIFPLSFCQIKTD